MINKIENNIDFSEIKKLINSDFSKLSGYVFKYDKNGYNETIFKNFLGINLEDFENVEDFLEKVDESLKNKIKEFENLINKINSNEINIGNAKSYILKNLEESLKFVKNLENITKIETQKIKKFNFKLEEKDLNRILEKIESFEKEIYGENLSENQEYSLEIIESLEKDFEKNKDNLEKEEIIFMQETIKTLREKTGNIGKIGGNQKNIIKLNDSLESENKDILNKKIKREDYIKIFENCLKILGINDVKVEIDEKVGNFSANSEKITIPGGENYEKLTIKRIIDLISHEIETHIVTQKNNENLVGFIKPIGYVPKEEGIAMTFGGLASGKNLDEINKPGKAIYQVLFCELIAGKENLEKFLDILDKISGEYNGKKDNTKRIERLKRGRDFEKVGVNPKEKAYFLGRKKVIEKINGNISENENSKSNILNLFIGKNSFDAEKELTKVLGTDKDFSLEKFREKGIILPLMIGEILKYKLLTKQEKNNGLLGGFLKYFNDKYGPIFNNLGINYKDFVKNYIGTEKEENKKRIKEILELFLKNE